MLPVAFSSVSTLTSIAGGLAASIAVGAFIGQSLSLFRPTTELERRRYIALGGFLGMALLIALFLFSGK
ncbi:MAG TPA: hypothetical protein VJ204_16390 [Solirubrobacterales bacterium]|nr:hypothetical protein [Solirubrobacterales bacterium]